MNDPQNISFDAAEKLAVFLECDQDKSSHTGFAYRLANEGVRLCHLLSHNMLLVEEPSEHSHDYFWENANFDDEQKDLIIGFCESVKKSNGKKVPYGFNHDGVIIDRYGNIKTTTKDGGLTCATFVMQIVLYAAGVKVLKTKEWQPTQFGTERQKHIVGIFIEYKDRCPDFTDEYIDNVSSGIGLPRISPEHVVAGCLSVHRPLAYEDAEKAGRALAASVIDARARRPAANQPHCNENDDEMT